MSLETWGWMILAFPLGGTVLIAFTSQILPSKVHGVIGTLAIALAFVCAVGALFQLQDLGEDERQVTSVAWDYANTVGVDAQLSILLDPLAIFMALVGVGDLDADPPVLGLLHALRRAATRASSRT